MLEVSQTAVVVPLLIWLVYSLVKMFGETRKLDHIPTIGFSDPILSYWSALQFLIDPPGFIRKGWETIPPGTKYVKVPGMSRWTVLGTVPEQYKEVASAADHFLSPSKATDEFLQAKHTMWYDEIGDHLQVKPIRQNLNRSLGELLPLVHEEAVLAFEDAFPLTNEWQSHEFVPALLKIVARISNRALVGLPLCRDAEYIDANVSYAVEVIVESFLLYPLPPFLRGLAHRLFSPIPGRLTRMTRWIQPILDARREDKAAHGSNWEEPKDMLYWLTQVAEEHGRADRDPIIRLMSTNFGSIHTTALTFTHALYSLLSRSQYIEALRQEIDQCVQEEGWTKASMDRMVFLDSFIAESKRYDILGTVGGMRIAIDDCILSGTLIPKGTMIGANLIDSHFSTSAWGPDAEEFDPYRFIKIERETGRRIAIVTTSVNTLTFGHGKHACPGRFFAAQEMKLMMAYLLHHYDMKLDNKDGSRPKNMWIGMGCVPSQNARVLFRRRE
ncbi:hypothetical protein D9611_008152 [Ephemerocybe angulata]|uniref:Cytochrome P450 n=1 Tax=Ephemerocybe angulata TaxID=980116 RepID=A0A8H5C005_9AGAR|nr:hypothetical protein D9611_008152 [Tulosesus angulatus]